MQMVTKNKEVNLKESLLIFPVGRYKFYFSTLDHYNKFKQNYENEIKLFNERLNNAYRNAYDLTFSDLAIIRYYNKVEKYGFYLEIDGIGCDCLEKVRFQSEVKVAN